MVSSSTDRFNGVVASKAIKVPCVVATSANITLSGNQTIDGVAVTTGDRVLVRAQTNAVENGIYVVDSGAWDRAADWDGNRDIARGTTIIAFDAAGDVTQYILTTDDPIQIGSTAVTIEVFQTQAGAAIGAGTVTNAVLRWDGVDTWRQAQRVRITAQGADFQIYDTGEANHMNVTYAAGAAVFSLSNVAHNFEFQQDINALANIYGGDSLLLAEKSASGGGVSGRGRLWVRDDVPNVLVFTDEAGTDVVLGESNVNDGTAAGQMVFWDTGTSKFVPTSDVSWDDTTNVFAVAGALNNDPGVGSQQHDAEIKLTNASGQNLVHLGYDIDGIGGVDLRLWNKSRGSTFYIRGTTSAGASHDFTTLDPDGDCYLASPSNGRLFLRYGTNNVLQGASAIGGFRLYNQVGEYVVQGTTRAAGALLILNDFTHGSPGTFQRALTESDTDQGYVGKMVYTFTGITTAGDPGTGVFRLNNADYSLATELYIDDLNKYSKNSEATISRLVAGDRIYIGAINDPTVAYICEVTGAPTDNTGWWTIPISYVDGITTGMPASTANYLIFDILWSSVSSIADGTNVGDTVRWDGSKFVPNSLLRISNDGYLTIPERSGDPAREVGYGHFWVNNDTQHAPMFTDDAFATNRILRGAASGTQNDQILFYSINGGVAESSSAFTYSGSQFRVGSGATIQISSTTGIVDLTMGATESPFTYIQSPDANLRIAADASFNAHQLELSLVEFDILNGATLFIEEVAAANADKANFGQFWVRNDVPCTPMFTDDTGVDYVLNDQLPTGTVADSMLRWSGSQWEEITGVRANTLISGAPQLVVAANQNNNSIAEAAVVIPGGGQWDIYLLGYTASDGQSFGIRHDKSLSAANEYLEFELNGFTGGNELMRADFSSGLLRFNNLAATLTTTGNFSLKASASATSPGAGYGKIWVQTGTPTTLWFTDSSGNAYQISDITSTAQTISGVKWAASGSGDFAASSGGFISKEAGGVFRMEEEASGPTAAATYGYLWVEDDAPNRLKFRDDAGSDWPLQSIHEAEFAYSSTVTAADPGTATVRFDSVTIGSIANMYIDDLALSEDWGWILSNLADGDILVIKSAIDPADYIIASVNGTTTDNTGWWTVPLTLIHTGTIFTDGDPLRIEVQWFSQGGGGATTLAGLTDTNITTPANGHLLMWDATPGEWVNATTLEFAYTFNNMIDFTGNVSGVGMRLINADLLVYDNNAVGLGTGSGTVADVRIFWDGVDLEIVGSAANQTINFRDGHHLRLWDSNDTDWLDIHNNGANIILTESGLTEIQFPAAGTLRLNMVDNEIVRPILTDYSIDSTSVTPTGTTQTITYSTSNAYEIDLESATGNVTVTISGGPPTGTYGQMVVKVTQDSTTARTITWAGGTFRWPGGTAHPVTTTLNGFTIFTFETWDGGTTWWGTGADYS